MLTFIVVTTACLLGVFGWLTTVTPFPSSSWMFRTGAGLIDASMRHPDYNHNHVNKDPNATLFEGPGWGSPYDCYFQGKGYFGGQEIHLNDPGCLKCVCKKGFKNHWYSKEAFMEKFCERIVCELEVYYPDKIERGCNPIYFQDSNGVDYCCPVNWKCPDENKKFPCDVQQIPEANPHDSQAHSVPIFGLLKISQFPFGINKMKLNKMISSDKTTPECVQWQWPNFPFQFAPSQLFHNSHKSDQVINNHIYSCGNQMNFDSLVDCEHYCNLKENQDNNSDQVEQIEQIIGCVQIQNALEQVPNSISSDSIPITPPEVRICHLSVESGHCEGNIVRYYYDYTSHQCQQFIYSGCGGNSNNFYSFDKCRMKCHRKSSNQVL